MRRLPFLAFVAWLAACGGGGSDVTPPVSTPSITVSVGSTTVTATPGTSATVPITVTRAGGATGDIALAAEGLPANVTASFAPTPIPGTSTASTMTLVVGAGAAAATTSITVRATLTGAAAQTATVALTVGSVGSFSLSASAASAVQAATGTSTVTITRAGGFAGAVALTTGTLPANVTASFNPASATGASSALTFTAGASAAPGSYTVAVNGAGTGVANQTTNVALTVTASGGGGGNVVWQFCDASRVPAWLAFRNGASGAWTRVVAGANNTFSFTLSQNLGGVAFVTASGGNSEVEVSLGTHAELQSLATQECVNNPLGGKTLNGSVTGLAATDLASIAHGGATANATFAASSYMLQDVDTGPQDLFAYRTTLTATTVSRIFLQRGVNVANGGTLPVVDFNGASSFAPATAVITIANGGSDSFFMLPSFASASGGESTLFFDFTATGTTRTLFGVPTDRLIAGDLHSVIVFAAASNNIDSRGVVSYFRIVADRIITLGPVLTVPTLTSSNSGGLARPRARATIQSEYGDVFQASFAQNSNTKTISMTVTRGYLGAATEYDLETPDFAGVVGFNSTWGMTAGAATDVTVSGFGGVGSIINRPVDGTTWRLAQRSTTFTP